MTSHQLHALADQIAARERITHREACARLGRRRRKNYGRTRIAPALGNTNSNVEKPAAYWWQKDN